MENKRIIVCRNNNVSFYADLKKEVPVFSFYKNYLNNQKMISKIIRFILRFDFSSFFKKMFYGEWYKLYLNGAQVVFFDDVGINKSLRKFVNLNPQRFVLFLCNPTIDIKNYYLLSSFNCNIYSFDNGDCLKYNFKYKPLVAPFLKFNEQKNESDIYFLGQDKGRKKILDYISKELKNVKVKIEIIDGLSNFKTYDEYIKDIYKTNCILEVLQDGQKGMTIRTIESLLYKKKLITNNVSIKNTPYFKDNNILIVDDFSKVSESAFVEFLNKKYVDYDECFYNSHQSTKWLQEFDFNDSIKIKKIKGDTMKELKTFNIDPEIRDEYLVNTKQKKIRNIELELLDMVDKFCKKNNIKYFIFYGTLLGAIRHKSFIPWDDDLDIVMTRKDYDKFCELFPKTLKHPFFLQNYKTDPSYYYGYARFRNSDTTGIIESMSKKKFNNGIFIDIFVLDKAPNTYLFRLLECYKQRILMSEIYFYEKFGSKHKILKPYFAIRKLFYSKEKLIEKSERQHNKFNNKKKKNYWVLGLDSAKQVCPAEIFEKMNEYEIEGNLFYGPENYDYVLKLFYGDYMKYPPIEERGKWHDGMITFDPDVSYIDYFIKNKDKYPEAAKIYESYKQD